MESMFFTESQLKITGFGQNSSIFDNFNEILRFYQNYLNFQSNLAQILDNNQKN
ncbi:MAG: hypothetical protein FD188_3232 [Ignavibacteria bacterium]|nr:MAG: hypothetical protein FD188_3232 [Ignavibacteria bacterium]